MRCRAGFGQRMIIGGKDDPGIGLLVDDDPAIRFGVFILIPRRLRALAISVTRRRGVGIPHLGRETGRDQPDDLILDFKRNRTVLGNPVHQCLFVILQLLLGIEHFKLERFAIHNIDDAALRESQDNQRNHFGVVSDIERRFDRVEVRD